VNAGTALLAAVYIFIWASAFTSAKIVVQDWSPLWALAIRFALTAPIILAIAWRMGARIPARGDWPRVAAMGALGVGGYLAFAWAALAHIPSGLVAFISAGTPLFVALGEVALQGRRLAPQAWAGLALGWAGVAILGLSRAADGLLAAEATGLLLALGAAASQALGFLAFAPARGRVDVWAASSGQSVVSALLLLVVATLVEGAPRIVPTLPSLLAMLYSIVIVGVGAYALMFVLLRRLPASTAAAMQLLSPPVAALLGWAVLAELLAWSDLLGGLVTLAGLLLLVRARA
jgi:drug/metabolite transporter (DMT)-like permease